jgi:hypothetical protein
MKPSSIKGRCALCAQEQYLCKSHFLPKALYRLTRTSDYPNPNPVIVTADGMLHSSEQITEHMLCVECEQRFRHNGEDWVLKHCLRGPDEFRLREELFKAKPAISSGDSSVYHAAALHRVDFRQLAYFAASVFWRGSRPWKLFRDKAVTTVPLGKAYSESLRQYLLDRGEWPRHMVLTVLVSDGKVALLHSSVPSTATQTGPFRAYQFDIPGISFTLAVGRLIPEGLRCFCLMRGFGNPILVSRAASAAVFGGLSRWTSNDAFFARYGPPKPPPVS